MHSFARGFEARGGQPQPSHGGTRRRATRVRASAHYVIRRGAPSSCSHGAAASTPSRKWPCRSHPRIWRFRPPTPIHARTILPRRPPVFPMRRFRRQTPNVSETPVASEARVDEVKAYLWSVYQRSPTKVDGHGDFTWKDVSAAGRSGLSVEDYVIGGLDPDFRELLFAAGHAMDAAGVGWTILSGFRDDFRQDLVSGLKARVNNSFHGGSEATGGYRHGCAVDLASVDRLSDDKVWNWVDRKGREFGLFRPLRAADPAHTLPMAGWHDLAATLRNQRLGISAEADPAPLGDVVTLEQYLCIRPLPPEKPAPGAEGAQASRHPVSQGAANHGAKHDANSPANGPAQKPNGVREAQTKPSARTAASNRGAVEARRPDGVSWHRCCRRDAGELSATRRSMISI